LAPEFWRGLEGSADEDIFDFSRVLNGYVYEFEEFEFVGGGDFREVGQNLPEEVTVVFVVDVIEVIAFEKFMNFEGDGWGKTAGFLFHLFG
jgi:hypothetical protein